MVEIGGVRIGVGIVAIATLAYGMGCAFITTKQQDWIFNPKHDMRMTPDQPPVNLDYETVQIPIENPKLTPEATATQERLNGWWIPSSVGARLPVLPEEPHNVATSVNVILYLGGRGGNRSYHLPRIEGFHQLGFNVLIADYRGFGDSNAGPPSEASVYQDAAAAWRYLTQTRGIPPEQILIYGESLGGAIALDLALYHPDAGGLIMQSTFTSMTDMAKRVGIFRFFPLKALVTERFASIEKIKSLKVPVLLLHGTNDEVVPYEMSERLYDAAPTPKQLFLIPDGSHFQIYRPGNLSYLKAIERFLTQISTQSHLPAPIATTLVE